MISIVENKKEKIFFENEMKYFEFSYNVDIDEENKKIIINFKIEKNMDEFYKKLEKKDKIIIEERMNDIKNNIIKNLTSILN